MIQVDISNMDQQDLIDFTEKNIVNFKDFDMSIVFKADYSQSKMIRGLILYIFDKNNITVPWRSRFSLISDELISNSIEYGSSPLDKNIFILKFKIEENFLDINIEVHDTGKGAFAKTSVQMEEIRRMKEAEDFAGYLGKRGRGLFFLIKNIVDDIYFKDKDGGGLIVGVTKKINLNEDK